MKTAVHTTPLNLVSLVAIAPITVLLAFAIAGTL